MDLNALNNPPVDPNSRKRHPPEGSTAVFSASIAAAANTAVYTEKYGGRQYHLGNNKESSKELADDDCSGYKSSETNYREYYDSDGTGEGGVILSHVDIDDDDYVDLDSESEDKKRTLFPKNKNQSRQLLVGGPQARDTTGMTDSQKEAVECKYKILRKKWKDAQHWERLTKNKIGTSLEQDGSCARYSMDRTIN
jgi:hypothetical protein